MESLALDGILCLPASGLDLFHLALAFGHGVARLWLLIFSMELLLTRHKWEGIPEAGGRFVFIFIATLLRYNSHTIKFILLKCARYSF